MNALITLGAAFLGSSVAAALVQHFLRSSKDKNPDLWGARFKAAQELIPALDKLESSVYSSAKFMEAGKQLPSISPTIQQLQLDLYNASLKEMGSFSEVFQQHKFCLPSEIREQVEDFIGCCMFAIAKFGIGTPSIVHLSPTADKIKDVPLKDGREAVKALRENIQNLLSLFLQVS